MSHSSTLITSRVSHRVSTSSSSLSNSGDINMALASDTLFDKFGLFDNTGVHVQPSTSEPEYPGLSTLPTFENLQELDFAELLEIKEEPLIAETNSNNSSHNNSNSVTSNITSTELDNLANNVDPFFMDSPILDDASLDSIKSDCMWGMPLWNSLESATNALNSNQDYLNSKANSRKRRRDVSLTLSECAEGLLSINHLDVNMFDSAANHNAGGKNKTNNPTLGSSPSFLSSSFGALDADDGADEFDDDSFASSTASEDEDESDASSNDDSEDEEEIIDVVSTDLVGSSARTRHAFSSRKTQNHSHIAKHIEAGRSLLKKQFPKSENNNTKISSNMAGDSKLDKQTSILSDHSYFLTRPEHLETEIESHQAKSQIKGMLTPNESSEDEDMDSNNSLFATGTPTIMTTSTNLVDKRKIGKMTTLMNFEGTLIIIIIFLSSLSVSFVVSC